jgi:hypothetical protein
LCQHDRHQQHGGKQRQSARVALFFFCVIIVQSTRSEKQSSTNVSQSTSSMITLHTVPVDLLLNVGTYLDEPDNSQIDDINEITFAATLNDYEMLEHYIKKYNYKGGKGDISDMVARSGNMKVLKWVRSKDFPWASCVAAAESGNLKMLKWLVRGKRYPAHWEWDEYTSQQAAKSGNLEMVQWLRSKGCRWNETSCVGAAGSGNLEMLQWLRSKGCPWNEWVCYHAAMNGHLEMLQWAHSAGCLWIWNDCCRLAADKPEMLEWLKSPAVERSTRHLKRNWRKEMIEQFPCLLQSKKRTSR